MNVFDKELTSVFLIFEFLAETGHDGAACEPNKQKRRKMATESQRISEACMAGRERDVMLLQSTSGT